MAERGFVYDKELDPGAWSVARDFLGGYLEELSREKKDDYRFPLSAVAEAPEGFLFRSWLEAKEALQGNAGESAVRASCFEEGEGGCLGCGACVDEETRSAILDHRVKASRNARAEAEELGLLVKAKRAAVRVPILVEVPRDIAGASGPWVEAWVLRELFSHLPETVDLLLAARRDFPSPELPSRISWHGRAVFSLLTLEPARLAATLVAAFQSSVPDFLLPGADFSTPEVPPSPPERLSLSVFGVEPASARAAFAKVLEGLHLPGTLQRDGGGFEYRLSPKALKKKTLRRAVFSEIEDPAAGKGFLADLTITEKFDLPELDEALTKLLRAKTGTEVDLLYRFS